MAIKVILPMLGQTMEEGTITQWFKQEGDKVEKDEALFEVLTDKVNLEVEAPESGILRKIIAKVDDTVPIMAPVAIIGTADEPIDALLAEEASEPAAVEETVDITMQSAPALSIETPAESVSPSKTFISPRARMLAHEHEINIDLLTGLGTGPGGRIVEKDVQVYIDSNSVKATPLAASIANVEGVDLRGIDGTGAGGRVTKGDVLQMVAPAAPAPAAVSAGIEARSIPYTGMRKIVADNVAKSAQTAPHVTLTLEVDMTEAVKVRTQVVGEFEKKYGSRLTYTDMIIKAAATAILEHPMVNSSIQGSEIKIFPDVNVGLAASLEDKGLIVPVIKNADRMSLAGISLEAKRLVAKARGEGLGTEDISGGTFTITNLGAFGIDVFDPIIVTGQAAILGVCRIAEKPVVVNGEIAVRSMMNLCLSFDHRILDGVPAAKFLASVKALLESPWQLVI
jgi:pyruvate dehydrogenase E2 component (dihydrolipoamide acetyltransferase)